MALLLPIISILLILLTPLSYLPQCKTLNALRTTDGISVTAALLLALCAQSQMCTMYYLWACPPFKRDGDIVHKPPLILDYVNLAQLMMQWICSLLYLALLVTTRTHAQHEAGSNGRLSMVTAVEDDRINDPSQKTIITVIVSHLSLCIFWALAAGQPTRDWLDLPFVTIMGINQYCINPLITIITIVVFILQASKSLNYQCAFALNRTTVILQAVTFLLLAVSWPFRFKVPPNRPCLDPNWLYEEWYPLVGWTCVNSVIIGFGQLVVFYVSSGTSDSERLCDGERQALLAI